MPVAFGTVSAAGWTAGVPPPTPAGITSLLLPPEPLFLVATSVMATAATATTTAAPIPVIQVRRRRRRASRSLIQAICSRAFCLFLPPLDTRASPLILLVTQGG